MSINTLAQSIPEKYRKIIYSVLGVLVALEAIFDVVEPGWESKILAALVVLGFGGAFANTGVGPTGVGAISVETDEAGTKTFSLELDGDPADLENLDEVSFKVNS